MKTLFVTLVIIGLVFSGQYHLKGNRKQQTTTEFVQEDPVLIDFVRDEGVTFSGTKFSHSGAYNLPAAENVSSKYNYAKGSCYHSVDDNTASWTVTFKEAANVQYLTLLNRGDCCDQRLNNFEVLLDDKVCFSQVEAAGKGEELTLDSCSGVASSATVRYSADKPRVNGQDHLTICGFSAFGESYNAVPVIDLVREEGATFSGTKFSHSGAYNLPAAENVSSKYNYAKGSCYHSVDDNTASWTVTFKQSADVSYLTLLNRGDCCDQRLNNFEVLLDDKVCFSQVDAAGKGEELTLDGCSGIASSATVRYSADKPRVNGQDHLTICGFSAFGSHAEVKPEADCPILYTECNFGGDSVTVCEANPNVDIVVKSVFVPEGQDVTLYNLEGYEGQKATFTESVECLEKIDFQFLQQHNVKVEKVQ